MDSERFDGLVRVMSSGATRRGMVLGVLAGLAGLGLGEVAAKRRQRNGKHRGKAKGRTQAASRGDKVTICHRTGSEEHPYQVITVAASAVPAHEAHGDLVRCPNLQAIDFETCTCVCPAADIVCENGQGLDLLACVCVGGSAACVPAECSSQDDACTTCTCNNRGLCLCAHTNCASGQCDPITGCP